MILKPLREVKAGSVRPAKSNKPLKIEKILGQQQCFPRIFCIRKVSVFERFVFFVIAEQNRIDFFVTSAINTFVLLGL